ncbi:MAG: hypothetical protein ABSC16_05100 [Candidatus Dormibacteria bacterium]
MHVQTHTTTVGGVSEGGVGEPPKLPPLEGPTEQPSPPIPSRLPSSSGITE